jgi:hypothetical protein
VSDCPINIIINSYVFHDEWQKGKKKNKERNQQDHTRRGDK